MTPEVWIGRTDHVRIRVLGRMHDATDYWDGNWLVTPVSARIGGFSAEVATNLRAEELARFRDGVRRVHETMTGAAELVSMEEWLEIRLTAKPRGGFRVTGTLSDDLGRNSNSLRFAIDDLDQTNLAAIVDGLDEVIATFPVLGAP